MKETIGLNRFCDLFKKIRPNNERILPIPQGYKLLEIKNNQMILIKEVEE